MLLCVVKGVFEETPDAAGDVALEAAGGFAVGLAFAGPAGDVGASGRAGSLADEGDDVERLVELAVAGAA